ncbi:MAG: exodeoxyribonuclease VII small subunit [Parachlamydiales bacterium]
MNTSSNESTGQEQLSFEAAFHRLEELLEKLNNAETPLEDALKCYEEADKLISQCNKRLNTAEKKIEKLIKNRNDEVQVDEQGRPKTEPFST